MAYLLDTNVLSELRKKRHASPLVVSWFGSVEAEQSFLSALTLGEVRRGIELCRRKDTATASHLERWLAEVTRQYAARILPVSQPVAELWGRFCLEQPLPLVDGLLAATALHHDLVLVTRNVADVQRSGARVFNPFEVLP